MRTSVPNEWTPSELEGFLKELLPPLTPVPDPAEETSKMAPAPQDATPLPEPYKPDAAAPKPPTC